MRKRSYLESCNGKYLASFIEDSVITYDEIIDANRESKSNNEETKTIPKNIKILKQKVSIF